MRTVFRWLKRKFTWRRIRRVSLGCLLGFLLFYYALPWCMPWPKALDEPPGGRPELTDRHGNSLRRLLAEGKRIGAHLPIGEIPESIQNATIAVEDQRFYSHGGIDFIGMARAGLDWVKNRRAVSGASTITQQLVKIVEPRPRNAWTKILEILTARRVEMTWSKPRILEEYLNRLDYGNLRIGCAEAAEGYFAKPIHDCSIAESALLAGLPQSPTRFNPYRGMESCTRRQGHVLERMLDEGKITAEEKERAEREPLLFRRNFGEFRAPHFVDFVLTRDPDFLPQKAGRATTLDLEMQTACERIAVERIARLADHNVRHVAVVVIDNKSGGILAMVGSPRYSADDSGQVNGATSRRSPGSALKPFTYLLALEEGLSPASIIADLPLEYMTPTGLYRPKNYAGHTYGPVSLRAALANSLNLSAVKVLDQVGGARALMEALQRTGVTTLTRSAQDYGLGLTIGGGEVQLLELTNAYATLARHGAYLPWTFELQSAGETNMGTPVFDPLACYLITDILADNDARVRSFGMQSNLRLPFPVAVKTGTSSDYRDNWTIGYTPEFTVGVWVGNFDNSPMREVSGVTGAGPIFHDIFMMLAAHQRPTWFTMPAEIAEVEVDPLTGLRIPAALQGRRTAVREKFVKSRLPEVDSFGAYDQQGRVQLGWEYESWLAGPDNWLGEQAVLAPEVTRQPMGALKILTPLSGSTYFIDPDLPNQGRILTLAANSRSDDLAWSSATLKVRKNPDGRWVAELQPGDHKIELRESKSGASLETRVIIKRL